MKEENCYLSPYFGESYGESYLEGRARNVSLGLSEVFESVLNSSRIATKKMEKETVRP